MAAPAFLCVCLNRRGRGDAVGKQVTKWLRSKKGQIYVNLRKLAKVLIKRTQRNNVTKCITRLKCN